MKLKNISNRTIHTVNLAFPIKRKSGINMSVVLKPGECIYVEDTQINSKVRIFERKNFLEVINEEKPNTIDFYKVYSDNFSRPIELKPKVVEVPVTTKKSEGKPVLTKKTEEKSSIDTNPDKNQKSKEIDTKPSESSENIKKKPGRPFGTIRKPKSDKPKRKPGRPFGTIKKPKADKIGKAESDAEKYIKTK